MVRTPAKELGFCRILICETIEDNAGADTMKRNSSGYDAGKRYEVRRNEAMRFKHKNVDTTHFWRKMPLY